MGKRTANVPVSVPHGGCDWREALLDHARLIWSESSGAALLSASAGKAKPANGLDTALGPISGEALAAVNAFALGARQLSAAKPSDPIPAQVLGGLDLILRGIAAKRDEGGSASAQQDAPLVIQLELWHLLRKVRESAELCYSRQIKLIDLDRRLLMLLRNLGPTVPADIAGTVGVDKAQVSRSVKRLMEMGLITRKQIRSPLCLTSEGEAQAQKLVRVSELRNRELTFEIGDAELAEFFTAIRMLLDRAVALFEQERDIALGNGKSCRIEEPIIHGPADAALDRTRIIAPLLTLSSYFGRSGALAFKRLTGLSKFEAFVLQAIAGAPPIDWADLVASLRRDHSQAGRTVNALMERGLISREGKPERRHGRFFPTGEGKKVYKVLQKASRERSMFLLAPLTPDAQEKFFATLTKIRRNARAQLERERALAELDRSES